MPEHPSPPASAAPFGPFASPFASPFAGPFASPLAAHAEGAADRCLVAGRAGVVLTPIVGRAIFGLRAAPAQQAMPQAVLQRLGLALPAAVSGSADAAHPSAGALHALWIGPGDWLVTCGEAGLGEVAAALRAALAGASGALNEVGHGHAVLNLSGPNAVDVLAQGCGLDLHPSVFANGHCAMTGLARMPVVIDRRPRAGYDLYVARSFAASLWHFLTTAATEFGYRVAAPAEAGTVAAPTPAATAGRP